MRHLISAAALAACLATTTTVHAAPVTTASAVTYEVGIFDLTVTPTGPTTLNLNVGEAFHIEGTWQARYVPASGGCEGCYHQVYLAGLPPLSLQINLSDDLHPFPDFSTTDAYSGNFNAPLTAGRYYIGAALTLDYNFVQGVSGATNADSQVSYILNVSDAPTVPEPASLVLLGTGLLGVVARLRRKSA